MKFFVLLKHIFIPHDKNDYKPHFFRELSVAIILFASIFLLGASMGSSFFIHKTVLGTNVAASVLIDNANVSRLAYNEAPLIRNYKLDKAANLKGENMAQEGYFSHDSPKGITPWHWFQEVGYTFLYAGENLAINFTESADVHQAWLDSPLHRANLLNVKFNEIGMATVEGVYENNPTIYVVQMFGTPAIAHADNLTNENTTVATSSNKLIPTTKTIEKISAINNQSTSTKELALALTKMVKGESVDATSSLEAIMTTSELAIVKNTSELEIIPNNKLFIEKYSNWSDKLLFGGSRYVDMIYKALIMIVAFAFVIMILIEYKKQHYKHILYGVVLLLTLVILVYINRSFF